MTLWWENKVKEYWAVGRSERVVGGGSGWIGIVVGRELKKGWACVACVVVLGEQCWMQCGLYGMGAGSDRWLGWWWVCYVAGFPLLLSCARSLLCSLLVG